MDTAKMARPNQTRFALLMSSAISLLLTTSRVNSASSPSCRECAPFIPGAVAYWPMINEINGYGLDMSGNDNYATFVGLTSTDGPTGETQGAVHFNGSSNSYAKVPNSPSMNVGKYPGFSFSGYVRYLGIQNKFASLIDWSGFQGYGMFIAATPGIQLQLYPNQDVVKHKAEFPNHKLNKSAWHFIGLSYEKVTGTATVFKNGKKEVKHLDKDIVAGTDKTSEIGLGVDLSNMDYSYHGDMSCMMLFKFALTAVDFKRVWDFCRTTNSTKKRLPNIAVSDIAATRATVSWTKSPGIFSEYKITIERKQDILGLETANPKFILSSDLILKSVLSHLISGANYRVHVWHMQGDIRGRARSSAWFNTTPMAVVESNSINFFEITATSAKVSWKDVTGDYDAYSVDISPTTGGAKADPNTVTRGTTTTVSLKNLFPGISYTITIRTMIGSRTSSPSERSFQTLAAHSGITNIINIALCGLSLIVSFLVVIVVAIALYVYRKRRHRTVQLLEKKLPNIVANEEVEEKGMIPANVRQTHLRKRSADSLLFHAS